MRFFIVDDDKNIRFILRQIIENSKLGKVVGEAEDGEFVDKELLNRKAVDILLIDFLMPVKDGIQVVREVKPFFDGSIVMLSQEKGKNIVGEAYAAGVHCYINKPINYVEIISVLKKTIQHVTMRKIVAAIA